MFAYRDSFQWGCPKTSLFFLSKSAISVAKKMAREDIAVKHGKSEGGYEGVSYAGDDEQGIAVESSCSDFSAIYALLEMVDQPSSKRKSERPGLCRVFLLV